VHGPAHIQPSGQEGAAGSAFQSSSLRSADLAVNGSPPRPSPVPGQGDHPRDQGRAGTRRTTGGRRMVQNRAAAHAWAQRSSGWAQGYCSGAAAAPCTCKWSRPGAPRHQRSSSAAACRWRRAERLGPESTPAPDGPHPSPVLRRRRAPTSARCSQSPQNLNHPRGTCRSAFFIENNMYAVSTTVEEATGETAAVGRAAAHRLRASPAWRVDGMEPRSAVHTLAMAAGAGEARRAGGWPGSHRSARSYRFFHPERSVPRAAAFGYRPAKRKRRTWRGPATHSGRPRGPAR